jgi:glycosyltransferase 2 family protein
MDKKKIRAIIFFAAGITLFWYVYRDQDLEDLWEQMGQLKWWWIGVSVAINLFSHVIKALRWKQLITPLDRYPRLRVLFLSNLVLAFTNLIIPRGGEIARLGVVNRFERISFSRLLGTALAERLTDLVVLLLLATALIIWQNDHFRQILGERITEEAEFPWKILYIVIIVLTLTLISYLVFRHARIFGRLREKLRLFWNEMAEGFNSLRRIDLKGLFIFYSLFQYALWLMMLYVLFFAFPPTSELSMEAAVFTFGLSTLAFLLPVQAGIGAWHFIVIQALMLFGVKEDNASVFALIAHSSTMLIHLVTGAIAMLVLPLVARES